MLQSICCMQQILQHSITVVAADFEFATRCLERLLQQSLSILDGQETLDLSRLLSQLAAARLLGVDGRTSRRWISGERAVPEPAARFLQYLIATRKSGEARNAGARPLGQIGSFIWTSFP